MATYVMALMIPARPRPSKLDWVRRNGSASPTLAWAPLVGDAQCTAAGRLGLESLASTIRKAIGKFGRHLRVVWVSCL